MRLRSLLPALLLPCALLAQRGGRGGGTAQPSDSTFLLRPAAVWNAIDDAPHAGWTVFVRGNVIERGRYGIHLMYCDNAQIEHNQILDNSVGIYTMYSADVVLRENLIRGQRGPSGYALGFKDADNVEVTDNALVDNRAGTFLDGTPFNPAAFGKFQNNLFAFNDVGVILLPAVRGNTFENNTFWENVEQVAVQGGGTLGQNLWQGNYWSDYTGFDANGDGLGDVPYRAERFSREPPEESKKRIHYYLNDCRPGTEVDRRDCSVYSPPEIFPKSERRVRSEEGVSGP